MGLMKMVTSPYVLLTSLNPFRETFCRYEMNVNWEKRRCIEAYLLNGASMVCMLSIGCVSILPNFPYTFYVIRTVPGSHASLMEGRQPPDPRSVIIDFHATQFSI